jgi:hypothetical protein
MRAADDAVCLDGFDESVGGSHVRGGGSVEGLIVGARHQVGWVQLRVVNVKTVFRVVVNLSCQVNVRFLDH